MRVFVLISAVFFCGLPYESKASDKLAQNHGTERSNPDPKTPEPSKVHTEALTENPVTSLVVNQGSFSQYPFQYDGDPNSVEIKNDRAKWRQSVPSTSGLLALVDELGGAGELSAEMIDSELKRNASGSVTLDTLANSLKEGGKSGKVKNLALDSIVVELPWNEELVKKKIDRWIRFATKAGIPSLSLPVLLPDEHNEKMLKDAAEQLRKLSEMVKDLSGGKTKLLIENSGFHSFIDANDTQDLAHRAGVGILWNVGSWGPLPVAESLAIDIARLAKEGSTVGVRLPFTLSSEMGHHFGEARLKSLLSIIQRNGTKLDFVSLKWQPVEYRGNARLLRRSETSDPLEQALPGIRKRFKAIQQFLAETKGEGATK